jgi:hypothetical protein
MDIKEATRQYEAWIGRYIVLITDDLELKHKQMSGSLFAFLRATFYRWSQSFPSVCPDLKNAPEVLAVGDLHIENFGTWRDEEGRLIWGINDFDEACPLPYTNDLVRLAVSARLAISDELRISHQDACNAILSGYLDGMKKGGRPFVLAEGHKYLREMALGELRDPVQFWRKLEALPGTDRPIPADAEEALRSMLPETCPAYRIARRIAGVGSLGRPRYVAVADWRGGYIAREIKALAPSAAVWGGTGKGEGEIFYKRVLGQAVRCPDPLVQMRGNWIVRRLAPDCSRIELASVTKTQDLERLLKAMGTETANVHLGTAEIKSAIDLDLNTRPSDWLHKAAKKMAEATSIDWEEWRTAS